MSVVRIMYIIGQLGPGGAERQLYELVKGINKDRFSPIVVSLSQASNTSDCVTKNDYMADRIRDLRVKVIQLPRRSHVDLSRLVRLIEILRKNKPHIVHTYLTSANSYGRIAALLARVPIIIASERSSYEIGMNKTRLAVWIDKILAHLTSAVICNSIYASKSLIDNFSFKREKIYTVHNGIHVNGFPKDSVHDDLERNKSTTVGMAARHVSWKNYNLFLDAAKIVINQNRNHDLRFVTVGGGPLRNEAKEYARTLGIENRVKIGRETDDIPRFLRSISILVSSSNYEGLSNSIMEAMAAGLPCVVTDVGGNSELVLDGKTGYVVPPNNPDVMADRIDRLINNKLLAMDFGILGKEIMRTKFSMERMIGKTESIYRCFWD